MPFLPWLSLLATAVLLILLPFLFGEVMLGGLSKLHVSPKAAAMLTIAMIIGGFINIPIKRIVHHHHVVVVHPLAAFGLGGLRGNDGGVQRVPQGHGTSVPGDQDSRSWILSGPGIPSVKP